MPSLQDLRDTSTPDVPSPGSVPTGAIGTPRRGVSYASSPIVSNGCAKSNIWSLSSSRAVIPSHGNNGNALSSTSLDEATASGAEAGHMSNMWSRYTWLKEADQSKNAFIEVCHQISLRMRAALALSRLMHLSASR